MNYPTFSIALLFASSSLLLGACGGSSSSSGEKSTNSYVSAETLQHLKQFAQQDINYIPFTTGGSYNYDDLWLLNINSKLPTKIIKRALNDKLDIQPLNLSTNGTDVLSAREILFTQSKALRKISLSTGNMSFFPSQETICDLQWTYAITYRVLYSAPKNNSTNCSDENTTLYDALVTDDGLSEKKEVKSTTITSENIFHLTTAPNTFGYSYNGNYEKVKFVRTGTGKFKAVDPDNPEITYPEFSINPDHFGNFNNGTYIRQVYTYPNGNDVLLYLNSQYLFRTSIDKLKQGEFPQQPNAVVKSFDFESAFSDEPSCFAKNSSLYCINQQNQDGSPFFQITPDGNYRTLDIDFHASYNSTYITHNQSFWVAGVKYANYGSDLKLFQVKFNNTDYSSTRYDVTVKKNSKLVRFETSNHDYLLLRSNSADQKQQLYSLDLDSPHSTLKALASASEKLDFHIIGLSENQYRNKRNHLLLEVQNIGQPNVLYSFDKALKSKTTLGTLPAFISPHIVSSVDDHQRYVFSTTNTGCSENCIGVDLWMFKLDQANSLQQLTFDGDTTKETPLFD